MTAPHLAPGHVVAGKYTLRALLGFTGEVATYHAASADGREVVVKLYDPAVGQRADVMAQLDRERQLIARLPPASVVAAFDAGYDASTGAPFSVAEHLQIPSLAKLIETGPLSPEVVAAVVRGVAYVLDAAHGVGLSHLALKPTNVFVGPAPSYPVRITDFDASVIRRTSPATHEVYAQSAPWWAPEQLQPAAVLGPATDVFSTALLAFYALTGRTYWLSCQMSPPDLPNWQVELMGQRSPVSQRARELGSVVNPLFDGVFGRALSLNQQDRPQSSMEIANVLAAAVGNEQAPQTMAFPDSFDNGSVADAPYLAKPGEQGGYVATGASMGEAGGPGGPLGPTGAAGPDGGAAALPPFPQPVQKKSSSPTTAIVIGVIVAVLFGGGAMALLFMRSPSSESPSATASGAASETAATSVDTAPEPAPASAPAPAAATSGSAPEPSAEPATSAEPEGAKVSVFFRCTPKCDRIELDGKAVEKPEEKLELEPGKHRIVLIKRGYLIHKEDIVVEAGKPIDKTIKLVKIGPVKPR